jgi:hypothetical protein
MYLKRKERPIRRKKTQTQQNKVQKQPTVAYWLSIMGAIIGLLAGLSLIVIGGVLGVFTFGLGFIGVGGSESGCS